MTLQLEHWPVDRLKDYARNPRKNDHAVDQMAAVIREFGFRIPCVVKSTGEVVDGHLRLKAARQLGLESVPVVLADELTDAQIKAFRLLANRSATWAEWDDELLQLELADLQALDFDLSLTGFDSEEIDALLAGDGEGSEGLTDEDDTPELAEQAISQRGDLWLLGEHRLLCGDATSADDVALLLGETRPHLMVTDPPYGVEYDPGWRREAGVNHSERLGQVVNDAWALFPGDVAYVWHAALYASTVQASLEACKFKLRSQIVWVKRRFVISRGHYHWGHEACWYAVREGATGHWNGARDQSTAWDLANGGEEDTATTHGTQKPVACMQRPILNNSAAGDPIYEPFSGSGTTLIACQTSQRLALAMEIEPLYVDLAVRRWQNFTGLAATRASDGLSFDEAATQAEAEAVA